MKHFAQCNTHKRESLIVSEQNNYDCSDADNNEDNNSSAEGDNDYMFAFVRSIMGDSPATNRGISEVEKRNACAAAARSEYERVSANYVEYYVPWSKLYNKRELNSQPN